MQGKNLILTGYMGSGKTTVGRALARQTGMTFQDLDLLLEERAGMKVSEIFERETEKGFRDRESALIRDLLAEGRTGMVYATGGGAPLREENRQLLKRLGLVVWLDAAAETVIERLKDASDRPLLLRPDREQAVKAMLEERRPAYKACGDMKVSVDGKSPEEIAAEILSEAEKGSEEKKKMKILVINGPNLNFLGIREKGIYGEKSYEDLLAMIREKAGEMGAEVCCFQSNHEGAIIDRLQEAYFEKVDGIVINPGAYTHYSYAIHDALKALSMTKVEVHISDVDAREAFRHVSVTLPACDHQIKGHGLKGYLEAMDYIAAKNQG